MTINLKAPELRELKPHIMVAGVGGAGGNAVNNMIVSGLLGVEFIVANTDAQALTSAKAERIIQMGLQVTEGLGAGSQPEVGRAAAEEAIEEIRDHLSGAHMVFVTAGMGGGTGTGAAPVIARTARDMGILTVGVVTKPFQFEGARRMRVAESGINELQKSVDTLIVIPNQNLFRIANEKTTFADAFAMADQVLYSGVACITDLMVKEGLINLDFADVRAIMREMGKAMMGTGEASGEKRSILAAEAAIANPLLDEVSMKGARGLLISITGGNDLTLYEVDEAASRIRQEVDEDANIILGATYDQSLDGIVRVSVVATGIDQILGAAEPTAAEARIAEVTNRLRAQTARAFDSSQPRLPSSQPEIRAGAGYDPRYEDPGFGAAAQLAAGGDHGVRVQELAPQPRHYAEQAQHGLRPGEHYDSGPFVPDAPDMPVVRPQRMPQIEDLPLPGQNQIRAHRGELSPEQHPEAKRRSSLLQKLASFGISRHDAESQSPQPHQPAPQPYRPPPPNPIHAEFGKQRAQHPPAPQRVPQPAAEPHGRNAYQARAFEEDQLEIPAFLRRQSS
ncbi:MAG: cell division protein FtsZ [Beijerinckiaceae bacterium]|nr:cell division protein FtsZ [Beijerinckiaceae bacterium]